MKLSWVRVKPREEIHSLNPSIFVLLYYKYKHSLKKEKKSKLNLTRSFIALDKKKKKIRMNKLFG